MEAISDLLGVFMSLAGDDQDVIGLEHLHRSLDGQTPIDLGVVVDSRRHASQDLIDDLLRILTSGIVAGHDQMIGPGGARAHLLTLALISLPSATEQQDQSTADQRAQGRDHRVDGIWSMGKIDVDPTDR